MDMLDKFGEYFGRRKKRSSGVGIVPLLSLISDLCSSHSLSLEEAEDGATQQEVVGQDEVCVTLYPPFPPPPPPPSSPSLTAAWIIIFLIREHLRCRIC
ncbi:unnamed protein product [Onchocerca flexuosa]|uniref:Uncharacterized protein n=1 Tax=Onchocerca flexuosa TaxID=387005 RepID=A0A183I4Q6_9BILA|nr:unnamed protein product [Onchocerca flexuosa]